MLNLKEVFMHWVIDEDPLWTISADDIEDERLKYLWAAAQASSSDAEEDIIKIGEYLNERIREPVLSEGDEDSLSGAYEQRTRLLN